MRRISLPLPVTRSQTYLQPEIEQIISFSYLENMKLLRKIFQIFFQNFT